MNEEIKPCPFCGSDKFPEPVLNEKIGLDEWTIFCFDCAAYGPTSIDKEDAIKAWNKRPYDFDMPAIVKKNIELKAKNAKLEVALKAYANHRNWSRGYVWAGDDNDGHELAESTLKELEPCKQPE